MLYHFIDIHHLHAKGVFPLTKSTQIQTSHCLTRIQSIYDHLSEKEKIVADYILNDTENFVHKTISEVAEELNVASATVFRLSTKLGFKGHQAMKIALASELSSPALDVFQAVQPDDSAYDIAQKVFASNVKTLEDTLRLLEGEESDFEKAIDALLRARKIDFYGNGGSGAIALDAHHKFLRTGLVSSCYTDGHLQMMSAIHLTKEDVVVCISHSGRSRDVLEAADVAKAAGATIIGITRFAQSPLSEMSDICLHTLAVETEHRSEALSSRLAQLSIIDALFVNVSIRLDEQMDSALKKLRSEIHVKRLI